MRHYLKATGSACYHETNGIVFPDIKINLRELLRNHGATNIRYARQFGWANQPKVLTFNIDDGNFLESISNRRALRNSLSRLQLPLVIALHWREKV
jgi:hypothetical protein